MRSGYDFSGFLLHAEQIRDAGWRPCAFPFNLPAVASWNKLEFHEAVTFIAGENGSGKSTLIEAIAEAAGFNPEGGSKDHTFSTNETHSPLGQHLRLVRGARRETTGYFLRAETFYTQTSFLDREGNRAVHGGRRLLDRSHGEGMFAIFMDRFTAGGLYILDEPEAALSPQRQLALLSRINDLVREGSQFIIATHSPILMAFPEAWIYFIDDAGPLRTAWEDVEHVDLMRRFLEHPDRFLDLLLGDES